MRADEPAYGIGHNQLAALAATIRAIDAGIRRGGAEQVARDAIEVGKQLIEAEALVRHGEWEMWLRDEFAWTQMTAVRRGCGENKPVSSVSVTQALAAAGGPPPTDENVGGEILAGVLA